MTDTQTNLQVRGIVLISIREYVQSRLKLADAGEFFKLLPFDVTHNAIHAERGKWYPYSMESALHYQVVRWFNPKNERQAILDLGLFTAAYQIKTFLRSMFTFLPLNLVFSRFPAIWSKLYRPGVLTVRSHTESSGVFELRGFSGDPLFCYLVQAWLEAACRHLKLKDVDIAETMCVHKGGGCCRWEAAWRPVKTSRVPASRR